jgi:outer membrane protein
LRKLLITALSALAISTSAFAADMKVGYVDISYIMAKSPQRVAITEKLKGEFKEQEEELKALLDEYKKLQEKAQKDGATMSEQERIDMSRQAQEMEGKLKLKQNALNEDMKRRGQEEQRMLAGKIMEQINALATEENYDMLVNKDALLFAKDAMNVSDKVLARLGASGN